MNYIYLNFIIFKKRNKGIKMTEKRKIDKLNLLLENDRISDTRIEIFGRKKLVVEGCYGIKEYSTEALEINLPKGTVIILGNDLELDTMTGKEISISGQILSLEFEGI